MTVDGVPGSSPPSSTRSAPSRIASGTSSSRARRRRRTGCAELCSTGQRRRARRAAAASGRAGRACRGSGPHASGKRPRGFGSSSVTPPGSSALERARVRGPSSGSAASARLGGRRTSPRRACPAARPLSAYRRATASRVLRVAGEPVDRVGREHRDAAGRDAARERLGVGASASAPPDHDALDAGEVARRLDLAEAGRAQQRRDRVRLADADLERDAARAPVARPAGASRRITSSPSAPAQQRQRGLVARDLGRELRAVGVGDVGRVGDDRVERPGDRRRAGRPRANSTSRPSRCGVGARDGQRVRARRRCAITSRSGRSCLSASAIAPEPVPTSTTRAPCGRSSAASTRCSVSGPRDQHARVDARARSCRKPLRAEDVGDRLALRAAAPRSSWNARACVGLEPAAGVGDQRGAVHAHRVGEQQLGVEPRRLAAGRGQRDERGVERVADRVVGERHPPVRHRSALGRRPGSTPAAWRGCSSRGASRRPAARAVISSSSPASSSSRLWTVSLMRWSVTRRSREVVGADLLRALAGADLRAAVGGELGLLLGELGLVEPRAQDLHRALAVLQLRLLVLHRDDDAGRLVRDPHRGVGRVDRLAARARRAVDVDLEVVRVDLDVDVLGLGQHRDGRRRGVDAALRLGLRHALDAVRAALELEDASRRRRRLTSNV